MSGVIPTIPRTHRIRSSDGFWRRRSGLVVPAVMLAVGIALIVGTVTMTVPANTAPPGPQLFPAIIAIAVIVLAALLAIDILRRPEPIDVADAEGPAGDTDIDDEALIATVEGREPEAPAVRPRSNLWAMLGAVGTVVVFIAALTPLGWLLSGAFLFWGIARSLGSRRPLFDIFLSLAISALVQIAFSGGLGLNLPPGILEGLF
ncbi:putative tricarboxylic transport membrane protein [Microbacterium sp. ru370.1]|uniref:tripartite tricarboxylate transporter TctB family protein n=1 Tax=unclassified Microbacterium TaxID=2609290 RepID=UPI00088ABD38|nr:MULTISPECIES: tripartite tricarboxylate transporter TctB family protein [unclassified Microbacterium]SDO78001.1 putative tricarboxylic transport membrane protein [Microbacterium sp. ru370.1]SIT89029.1 putative tricarboxylic transport membrane protein [Microbacterium sp. RU1D]